MRSVVYLNEEERQKAIALSEEMKISISALFRSVLQVRIPKTPTKVRVKAILKMGEVRNKIKGLMRSLPVEDRREFKELESLLEELKREIDLCP